MLRPEEVSFWATHSGAELNLLFFSGGKRCGVGFKFNEAPTITKSMHSTLVDPNLLHFCRLSGPQQLSGHEKITMLPLSPECALAASPLIEFLGGSPRNQLHATGDDLIAGISDQQVGMILCHHIIQTSS